MVYFENHTKRQYACVGNMSFYYIKAVRTYCYLCVVAVHISPWFSRVTINAEFFKLKLFFLSSSSIILTAIRIEGKTHLGHVPKFLFYAVPGSTFSSCSLYPPDIKLNLSCDVFCSLVPFEDISKLTEFKFMSSMFNILYGTHCIYLHISEIISNPKCIYTLANNFPTYWTKKSRY